MHRWTVESLQRGVLLFWATYLSLVTLTNVMDLLKVFGVLPATFPFASGNYQFIVDTTSRYGPTGGLLVALFAAVVLWELVAASLFWRALAAYRAGPLHLESAAVHAFVACAGLWGAFMVADELTIAYTIEATHLRLFVATLVSVVALQVLSNAGGQRMAPGRDFQSNAPSLTSQGSAVDRRVVHDHSGVVAHWQHD
jgi:hypothetical protein